MAKKNTKETVVSIPVVGYVARVASHVAHLPKQQEASAETTRQHSRDILQLQQRAAEDSAELIKRNDDLIKRNDDLLDKVASLEQAQDSFRQKINELNTAGVTKTSSLSTSEDELFADDHLMDKFYTDFEDRFRGSEQMIMERQTEYLPYFLNGKVDFKKMPVLDIGSGRGEFIELLKKQKIKAVGLDINLDMVERSKQKGLDAVLGDALSYLQSKKSNTYGAITGFHIAEHIPFNILMRIFSNALRTLVKDGFVIFETPNPENVIVGTHNFYMDPSHLHPLPPIMLAFALETCGFKNVEIKRLHPDDEHDVTGLPKEIAERFYGPRDYAVIGYK